MAGEAQSVFANNQTKLGGTFAADQTVITFGGEPFALVQSLSANYSQMVNRIYELTKIIGQALCYYVCGRAQGTGQMARILGPVSTMAKFYLSFGSVCKKGEPAVRGRNIGISMSTSCGTFSADGAADLAAAVAAANTKYEFTDVILNNISLSVGAQDMLFNESIGYMFNDMTFVAGA